MNHSHYWTRTLKALSDQSRLEIIQVLLTREASVNQLADILHIEVYNISKHLKILEDCGLVRKRKAGIVRIYRIPENLKTHVSGGGITLDLGCCQFVFGYFDEKQ